MDGEKRLLDAGQNIMGLWFDFRCKGCGYQKMISGGGDAGFSGLTQTIVCLDCEDLFDVFSALKKGGFVPVPLVCPKRKKHRVKPWNAGDPCPKCGTPINQGPERMMWD